MTKTSTTKAIGYVRVSTEEQAREGVSLDAQDERLRAYCSMCGLELVKIIREEGVSAGKPLADRPGGAALLRSVKSREVGHIVALKLDRVFRDAADALNQTRAWDKAGVALHLLDMGGQTLNTASAMGRMFLTVAAGFAELERNLIAERTASALSYKRKHGEKTGGDVPFGFDAQNGRLTVNQDEQTIIARIRELRASGASLREVAAILNAEGQRTKQGKLWKAVQVQRALRAA